jgi:hypothetical protein
MLSGLLSPVRTYHCFGEAFMMSEVLAARSRPHQVLARPGQIVTCLCVRVCDEAPVCTQITSASGVLWALCDYFRVEAMTDGAERGFDSPADSDEARGGA